MATYLDRILEAHRAEAAADRRSTTELRRRCDDLPAARGVEELVDLHGLAHEIGLDVLVEIHDETELEHALAAGADLVGVNQRDLVTFEVDQERAVRMASVIPSGVVRVAESGVRGRDDALALAEAGYAAVLVGESLVTSGDPAAALRSMRRG